MNCCRSAGSILVAIFLLNFGILQSAFGACAAKVFKVYYINLGTDFFAPPIPIEKNAEKTFEISDCAVAALFDSVAEQTKSKEHDDLLQRIKLVEKQSGVSILIDQEKTVLRDSFSYTVPPKILAAALSAVEAKAHGVKSKQQ